MAAGAEIFRHPHLVYHIAWHIDDAESYFNFGLVCRKAAAATKHWKKPKQTQFTLEITWRCLRFNILPNGELHGCIVPNPAAKSNVNWFYYYVQGILQPGCPAYIANLTWRKEYNFFIAKTAYVSVRNDHVYIHVDNSNIVSIRWCPECAKVSYYALSDNNRHVGKATAGCVSCRLYVFND